MQLHRRALLRPLEEILETTFAIRFAKRREGGWPNESSGNEPRQHFLSLFNQFMPVYFNNFQGFSRIFKDFQGFRRIF